MIQNEARAFLDEMSVRIYSPPFTDLREQMRDLPDVLRTTMLVLDFSTEVVMGGFLGFLENSTGEYLPETVEAMRTIGADDVAVALSKTQDLLSAASVSTQALRQDVNGMEEYEITTFSQSHPWVSDETLSAIEAIDISEWVPNAEECLAEYAESHLEELRSIVAQLLAK